MVQTLLYYGFHITLIILQQLVQFTQVVTLWWIRRRGIFLCQRWYYSNNRDGRDRRWEGYSIDGRYVFMSKDNGGCGIYNDVNNEWMIYCRQNAGKNSTMTIQ